MSTYCYRGGCAIIGGMQNLVVWDLLLLAPSPPIFTLKAMYVHLSRQCECLVWRVMAAGSTSLLCTHNTTEHWIENKFLFLCVCSQCSVLASGQETLLMILFGNATQGPSITFIVNQPSRQCYRSAPVHKTK